MIFYTFKFTQIVTTNVLLFFKFLWLTPWNWDILKKWLVASLFKIFIVFYGSLNFVSMPTKSCPYTLSWARLFQSISSYPISLCFVLILSSSNKQIVIIISKYKTVHLKNNNTRQVNKILPKEAKNWQIKKQTNDWLPNVKG